MKNSIVEAVLEMHFHKALLESFKKKYGARILKMYKPSQQNEKWLGYDQAWVKTELTQREFEKEMRSYIRENEEEEVLTVAYFYQFKVVERFSRKSKYSPQYYKTPYYRSEISTEIDSDTGLSQHGTLKRIADLPNSNVFYACGMVFDTMDIYEEPVNLDKLRLVEVKESPNYPLNDKERHFIFFKDKIDKNPIWKSEDFEGSAISAEEFMPKAINPKKMLEYLSEVRHALVEYKEEMKKLNKADRRILLEKNDEKKLFRKKKKAEESIEMISLAIKEFEGKPNFEKVFRYFLDEKEALLRSIREYDVEDQYYEGNKEKIPYTLIGTQKGKAERSSLPAEFRIITLAAPRK